MNDKWYTGFFEGMILEVWQKAVTPEWTTLEVDFLVKALQLEPGTNVLDVPCGFGRHSLELASRGYHMFGVDVSPAMIDLAKGSTPEGATVEWTLGDMSELEIDREFDAAFCFGNSFGYLDFAGTRTFLDAVVSALKPGSRFAFDYGFAAECILPRLQGREWAEIDDILFLEENRYLIPESCVETVYTLIRGGDREKNTGRHWVYTVREVDDLLREVGLDVVGMYKDLEETPFEVSSEVLFVVAEKPK